MKKKNFHLTLFRFIRTVCLCGVTVYIISLIVGAKEKVNICYIHFRNDYAEKSYKTEKTNF